LIQKQTEFEKRSIKIQAIGHHKKKNSSHTSNKKTLRSIYCNEVFLFLGV